MGVGGGNISRVEAASQAVSGGLYCPEPSA